MERKVKDLGQVYTPAHIVADVLDSAKYVGEFILHKHIMENSCGNGAFLVEIVTRYIEQSKSLNISNDQIKIDLETYIHAIDIDQNNVIYCIDRLNEFVNEFGIPNIAWDFTVGDSLSISKYDNSMDFVVGNPPYVRVHNLSESYDNVKKYKFAQDGMTDIYIVFFEIGLNMLKSGGILSYITASSYYNSLAGSNLRNYIKKTQSLYRILDLGHYNPFEEITYTTITCIEKNKKRDEIEYFSYDLTSKKPESKGFISYDELFINDNIILTDNPSVRKDFAKIYAIDRKKYPELVVKNGFATLADKVYILDKNTNLSNSIDIYKGSTGEWKKCLYPYDKNGKIISFEQLGEDVQRYLTDNKTALEHRNIDKNAAWYSFGRSQAINDVYKYKIGINSLIKDVNSIKIEEIPPGSGVYSGIYILSNYRIDEIKSIIMTNNFVDYIKTIKKYKNGGYYTFSTEDLNKYLLYKLSNISNNQSKLFNFPDSSSSEQLC